MKKKNSVGIPVGTSLLIVVMVLITLIAFSTISFVSATRDYQLSEEVAVSTQEYYEADCLAQEELIKIDEILQAQYLESNSKAEYFEKILKYPWKYEVVQDDATYILYKVRVNTNEQLYCKARIQYPNNQQAIEIITWKLQYEKEWKGNSTFPILIQ